MWYERDRKSGIKGHERDKKCHKRAKSGIKVTKKFDNRDKKVA